MEYELGYEALNELATQLQLGVTADELHGLLSGYLAAGARPGPGAAWLDALQLEPGVALTPDTRAQLEAWRGQVSVALNDPELGFDVLLPADDQPLALRAEALAAWCRGFLGGFGLGGSRGHAKLSAEANEYLRDLATIAATDFDYGEAETDESALTQVQEFVRMGALLLHTEAAGAEQALSGSLH
ncbi:hypothetical protein RF55_18268 [Lasius niger]|uniref:YecA family protein n=1 Tax=Lasius niger TaxID=67767 RepID=A0A0J7K1W1_LASNI|nr:hypothetical protein RF55_18268 [Lasius niger]